ncbi:MAG: adenylate/guanylate cyclase domain-containing protein [Candidatus Sericytochromatia bacterium]|nr:adenylate/guanylate cyclase domain-containing protein [Candidatus Sericytochromatia bacterium]
MLTDTLQRKLKALEHYPQLPAGLVQRFGELLPQLSPWQLLRLNPLQLAQDYNFDLSSLLDLLLYSTRIGLFDLNWTVVCLGCGSTEYTYGSINGLKEGHAFCPVCNQDVDFSLDRQVEVTFSLHPGIADFSEQVNPLASLENYYRSYFSASMKHAPELLPLMQSLCLGLYWVEPNERVALPLQAEPNSLYRVLNLQSHSQFWLKTGSELAALPVVVDTDISEQGFVENERQLPAGEVSLRIHNCSATTRILTFWKYDFEAMLAVLQSHPSQLLPFLSAQMLLNHQTFRELYKMQQLDPDLRLSIGSQTVMFTDLKGSTAMYEQTGDYQAYALVQRHFDLLTACTRRHAGSVVKTIGDAIMATFSSPADGLRAALEMVADIDTLNQPGAELQLGLKVGLHTGPVLAVNANERLDFFGQTVNLAARIQGLAEAGEIWVSETVLNPSTEAILTEAGYRFEARSAFLKGISQAMPVWRCQRD